MNGRAQRRRDRGAVRLRAGYRFPRPAQESPGSGIGRCRGGPGCRRLVGLHAADPLSPISLAVPAQVPRVHALVAEQLLKVPMWDPFGKTGRLLPADRGGRRSLRKGVGQPAHDRRHLRRGRGGRPRGPRALLLRSTSCSAERHPARWPRHRRGGGRQIWVNRFRWPDRLCSWAGLTPPERSSDVHTRSGHFSKQGPGREMG